MLYHHPDVHQELCIGPSEYSCTMSRWWENAVVITLVIVLVNVIASIPPQRTRPLRNTKRSMNHLYYLDMISDLLCFFKYQTVIVIVNCNFNCKLKVWLHVTPPRAQFLWRIMQGLSEYSCTISIFSLGKCNCNCKSDCTCKCNCTHPTTKDKSSGIQIVWPPVLFGHN